MSQKKYFAQLLTEKCSYKHSLHKYWGQRGTCAPAGICKCTVYIQVLGTLCRCVHGYGDQKTTSGVVLRRHLPSSETKSLTSLELDM